MHARWVALLFLSTVACQAGASRGASCARDSECASGLVCALDACRSACRESRDCRVGERCLVEPATGLGVCSVESVDDCTTHGCPEGLVCASGRCVNACGSVVRCPDGVCVGDVCIAASIDAGTPDGGTIDADVDGGPPDAATNCHGPGCDPVVQIAMSESSNAPEECWAYAVTQSGALWAWGYAVDGVLGDRIAAHGTCDSCAPTPVRALGPDGMPFTDVLEVRAGAGGAICVRRRDQSVWCWGANYASQRGDGGIAGENERPHAVLMAGTGTNVPIDGVVALRVGDATGCAIRGAAREVWCWGGSAAGALGDGHTTDAPVAIRATELGSGVMDLDVAGHAVLARLADGTLHGLGDDACGQLGVTAVDAQPTLVAAPVSGVPIDFALGQGQACALTGGGVLQCWGESGAALGDGMPTLSTCAGCSVGECTPVPQTVLQPAGHPFVHLFGHGGGTFFAVTAEGTLYAWGGQYRGAVADLTIPASVAIAEPVAEAFAAGTTACARTVAGDVYCWGGDENGQLGRGTRGATADPMPARVVWP